MTLTTSDPVFTPGLIHFRSSSTCMLRGVVKHQSFHTVLRMSEELNIHTRTVALIWPRAQDTLNDNTLDLNLLYRYHPVRQQSSIGSPQAASGPPASCFLAPELLFLHHVFWLGQHMYTGTCLHANDTQTAGSLTAASATFNFHFRSSSRIHILPVVRVWKWRVYK